MPSAPKSSKTACFDEVLESSTVDYKSYTKREGKETERYSEHEFAQLVAESTAYKQAMASLDAASWQAAILEKFQSIQDAGTWTVHDVSDLRAGRQPVGSQWVFKVKHNGHGSVERYKARIVGKG